MKAIRIFNQDGPTGFIYEDVPQPQPTRGEVLVRVYATGVSPAELGWGETWKTSDGTARPRPIPGHELSGIVEQVGAEVSDIKVGQEVYGLTAFDRDGSEAEYTIALPAELAPKPPTLAHVQAAAVPLSGLTAWQALFDQAHVLPGQTILIHGAAGGVGTFAVQLARWAQLRVIGVDRLQNEQFLRALGCDQVIDHSTTRFEDVVKDVDVVLDAVGVGDALDRSWQVLKKGGLLISLAGPPAQEQARVHDVRAVFFIVEPRRDELIRLGELLDAQQIRPVISKVLPLVQASLAYERKPGGRAPGKIVLQVVGQPVLATPAIQA